MSERAIAFVEEWVSENVDAVADQPDGNATLAAALADRCLNAAGAQGISRAEIAESFDDLTAFMAGELEEAGEREDAESEDEDDEEAKDR